MHWTIIGGGLQGTTIALKLKNEGLKNEELTIIDPYSSLCERFNIYTQRISAILKIAFRSSYSS